MKKILLTGLSIAAFIIIWQIAGKLIDSPLILPSFFEVMKKLVSLLHEKIFYQNLSATFLRVILSFFISITLGTFLGFLSGTFRAVKYFFSFPLALLRTTPVAALILILVFSFPSTSVPVAAAVLMTLPLVITSICTGAESFSTDSKMIEMTEVFGFTKKQKLFYMLIPALKPYFKTAVLSSFGMSWKVIAAGEVLSLPRFALGSAMANAQVHLETSTVLAYTLALVFVSYILETILKIILKEKQPRTNSIPPDPKQYIPAFEKKERLALIAPSGFGKTTLLNYIASHNQNVSYAFQEPRLIQSCTVFQNIVIPLLNKFDFQEAKERALYFICHLDLHEKKDVPVKYLSGGQAQRTSLARSLAFPSDILLLDEAFNAQDYELKMKIMDFIISELDKNPRTLIFVTHDERDGKYLCKKIIRLDSQENSSSIIR